MVICDMLKIAEEWHIKNYREKEMYSAKNWIPEEQI